MEKYYLIDEDGASILGLTATIDHPTSSKVGFYLYYFEVGLRVPFSPFFGQII